MFFMAYVFSGDQSPKKNIQEESLSPPRKTENIPTYTFDIPKLNARQNPPAKNVSRITRIRVEPKEHISETNVSNRRNSTLLRCVFDGNEVFFLSLKKEVFDNPDRYTINIYSDNNSSVADGVVEIDFIYNIEMGKSYEVFFNKNPYSVGGIKEYVSPVPINEIKFTPPAGQTFKREKNIKDVIDENQ
jgi:hypothetical protein